MADIFDNPDMIVTPSVNGQTANGKEYTGNSEVDAYINSLPENEREDALSAITAPKTGEEIHNEMNAADRAGIVQDPNEEDWRKLNQFYRTRDTDYLTAISGAAGEIYHTFGKAASALYENPSDFAKITPSVIEGAVQNVRSLYGIAAQSADSTSLQNKFFNILNGREEDSHLSYKTFLEARNFMRESEAYARGEKTILVDKNHLNNDFVQAAALVADPMMFIPFGKAFSVAGGVLGMGERSMMLAARTAALNNKIIGGTIKYAAGMPIEFIGKATRTTLDHAIASGEKAFVAATGVSSEVFRDGMRMSGVGSLGAGYFGHSVPLLTSASGAYVAGTAAAGVGEAVSVIGHQIMKGERGIASYARQALIDSAKEGAQLSTHSKALLKIIDGFDPLIDYTTTVAKGGAHGAAIGAGLGYWSGNEEGMAHGIGAGIALGSVGGTAGKILADVTGRTVKHRTSIQAKLVIEGLRDIHPEQAHNWEKAQAWAKARNFSIDGIIASKDVIHPNTHIEVLSKREYADYLAENGLDPDVYDGKKFLKDGDQPLSLKSFENQNGYVIENKANGMVKIYLNADAKPRATLGHEIFHSILRTSVMKDYYSQAVKEKVIGTRDANGAVINKGIVDPKEVKQMFRRYIDAEFKEPTERADALQRLELAESEYENSGAMVSDPALGGRPLLEHLSEEFGAYYFSHLVMDKPVDWLYHGGDLPGIRGVLDSANMMFRDYWRGRMNSTAPQFDFNRTFIGSDGVEKLVPIDEVFAPAKRNIFGEITGSTQRVVNPAMDMFFRDMLRIEKKVNETGLFDISHLTKDNQVRFIEGEGLDSVFSRDISGNYVNNTEAQIKKENKIKGKAVYKLLMGIPDAERTFFIDGEGSIRGYLSPQILDNIVNSGHMTRAMANKISLFQSITRGEAGGNIVDFGGIGATAERVGDVNNPSRMYGSKVPFKSRTGVVYGLDVNISKNGDFQFKGNMLDYKVIEIRANNTWSDPNVQSLWNGNHTEFMADFYRYLENASKSHDNPDRKPSAELWTDGKGSERRNAMHQVLGLAKGEADTFLNSPSAEINRNTLSSVFSFSLNRMTNLRVRKQSVPFTFENAYRDLVRNWSPKEMDSELAPNGRIFKHPSGFKLFQRQDGKTDAFDENGKRIGTFEDANKAAEGARKYAAKHPSSVLLKDNMTDNSVINRSPMQGEGEIPLINRSEAAEARRIGDLFKTREMQEFVGDRKLVRQTADEGYTDFIKKFKEGEIDQRTALYMLDEMSKDMFGGLDRQTKRIRLKELNETAKAHFEKENPRLKGMYKSELTENRIDAYLSLSELYEFRKLNKELAQPAPQNQLHSEFTASSATNFAEKIRQAKRWVEKASPDYNDFAGYIADNVPLREYYQHAVYSKQFRTGEPVVVVGVHGTHTSKGFLKDRKYKHDLRVKDLPLSEGEQRGAYFASSDATALNPEYQGYDPKKLGYEISADFRRPESDSPNIGKSALRFDNPLVVDGQQTPMMKRTEKILGEALEKGHDGVIYINQMDGGNLDVTFILPVETVNRQQRMIGSTREKAKAGTSYEPLPRGEGVTNRTVNLSPMQGEGEIPSREYPIYDDSIQGYQQYSLPKGSEPFPTRNILDFTPLEKNETPNPKFHSLWQMLDQASRSEKQLTIKEVLNFIKEQGISVHPNVRRGYLSQWAEALSLFITDENPNIVIETGHSKKKGWKYNRGENTVQFNKEYEKRVKEDGESAKDDSDDDGEAGKKVKQEKPSFNISEAEKVNRTTSVKSSENAFHLNLEELIDRMYGSSTRRETEFKKNKKGELVANIELSEVDRMRDLIVGHSFEATALEEIAHGLFDRASKHAEKSDSLLNKLVSRWADKSHSQGLDFKKDVDALISQNENRIKNGLYVDPIALAWTRLFKLHKHISENVYVTNGKSMTSLWDSSGTQFNTINDKVKYKLKEGYTLVDAEGRALYHDIGDAAVSDIYRLNNPQEFLVLLFNDPRMLARLSNIEFNPELLENLRNKGKSERLLPREERVAEELSKSASIYLSENQQPKHSVVNQVIEEAITLLSFGRRMKDGVLSNIDIPKNKVSHRYHEGIVEPKARPVGVITPWEKWYIQQHRNGLAEIARKTNTKNPLEGMSDWEAWQELKKPQYENPQYEPFIPYKNPKFRTEEAPKNVSLEPREQVVPEQPIPEQPIPEQTTPEQVTPEEPPVSVSPDEVTTETPVIGIDDILPKPKPATPTPTTPAPVTPAPVTPAPTQPKPMPPRDYTQADIRVWRTWKTETYGNGSALRNALGYIIMSVGKNYRVYNPAKALLGIYKDEEEAKRRVQREEPKKR